MSIIYPSGLYSSTGDHSSNLFDTLVPSIASRSFLGTMPVSGTLTFNGLVTENATALGGIVYASPNATFYNRILIEPAKIDLGNMLSNQIRTIKVWNGFFVNKNLSSVIGTGTTNMTLTGGPATPYNFRALEELTYTLTVSSEGPAAIDALYTWRVDGIGYTAEITGRRTIVFAFPIDFERDLVETLEWKTEIITSQDGSEQRRALRTKPRRSIGYYLSLVGFDQQLYQNSLLGWQNRVFALPVWTDKRVTTSAMVAGATTIPVNPANYSFVVGDSVILYADAQTFEVGEIASLTTTINLKNATSIAWPTGTKVYPLIQAKGATQIPVTRYTDTVLTSNVNLITSPSVTDPYIPVVEAPSTYDGLEVITVQPNWINNIDNSFEYQFDTVDKQTGGIAWFTSQTYGRILRSYSWLLTTRAEIYAFRGYLGRMNGRQKTCWVPSFTQDFNVIGNVGSSDTSIVVKDNGFRKLIGVQAAYDRIMIKMKNGTIYYRKINSITLAGDAINTQLNLNTNFGVAYAASDFKTIHLLHRCRLATDKVDLLWKANSAVIVSTTFMTVKL